LLPTLLLAALFVGVTHAYVFTGHKAHHPLGIRCNGLRRSRQEDRNVLASGSGIQRRSAALSSTQSSTFAALEIKPKLSRDYSSFTFRNKYKVNYAVSAPDSSKPPILLIHGFGGSINHFRFNEPVLTQEGYNVVRVDLLGFGGSDKPAPGGDLEYSMELFESVALKVILHVESEGEVDRSKKWIIGGNSIGGLTSLMVARTLKDRCRGVVLFNASGGMTSFRYEELPFAARPILWLLQNIILKQFGNGFWNNFKQPENVEQILKTQVYKNNNTNVDQELLDIILDPSYDEGAREVFLAVFGGNPGPTPEDVLKDLGNDVKILALWGTGDLWTPLEKGLHPGSKFGEMIDTEKGVEYKLVRLEGAGHCPMDEVPDACHEALLPWLEGLPE